MDLLERDAELSGLRRVLDDAVAGRGRVLLIEGPAGIGKTALLAAGRALATAAGAEVCAARGSEIERELGYGVVRQLLERRTLPGADGLFDGAAAAAVPVLRPGPRGTAGVVTGSLEVLHGLYWLCANLATDRPLVLAVDDAHWADAPSTRFLEYLAHRIEALPVLVLVSRRTSEPGQDSTAFLRLAAEPAVEQLAPAPLSEPAVTSLVRRRLGAHADPTFCRTCYEATGGNPFLVRELLAAACAAGVPPTGQAASRLPSMASDAVARSVALRLAALPDDAVRLTRAVAVLGGNAELRHAASLADLTPPAAAVTADELADAAILAPGRPLDFVHPLVRTAVYAELPAAARAAAHGRTAALLAAEHAAAGRIGVHLLVSEPAGDPGVVELLRAAARESLAQGLPRTAVGYLHRALAEPPSAAVRAGLLRELGSAEQLIGEPAIDHLREAFDLSEDLHARVAAARALTLALLSAERVADLEHVLGQILASCTGADPEAAIQLEAEVLSAARMRLSAGLWGARRVERWRRRVRGETPGERLMLANLATQTSLGEGSAAEAAELAERAVGGGRLLAEQTADTMPYYQMVYVLTSAERLKAATALVEHAADDARWRGSVLGTLLASLFTAYVEIAGGDIGAAEAHATLAVELADQIDPPIFHQPPCVGALVDVLVERGKLDDADRVLREHGMTGAIPDSVPWRILLFSRGNLRLAQRRWADAAADLLELDRRQAGWRALNPHLIPHDLSAALALTGLGDPATALRHARAGLERARRWGTPRALGLALRAHALVGPDSERLVLLEKAAAALARSPARLDEARVLVDLGIAYRARGQRSQASDALRRALDIADRCGAFRVAAQARDELRMLGLRPRRAALTGAAALTGSERRVAELAAAGWSNRKIAQTLFVTVRTVEVHLTRAYHKLGIQSRAQLAEALSK